MSKIDYLQDVIDLLVNRWDRTYRTTREHESVFKGRLCDLIEDIRTGLEEGANLTHEELVEKALAEGYTLRSWTVSENIMTLQMTGSSLKELNRLSQILEQESIVDQCVITTADRSEKNDVRTDVAATFTIYLQRADTETAADQAAASETAAPETEGGDGQ